MHENLFRFARAMEKRIALVKAGKCPMCASNIHPNTEFRDGKSVDEYRLSGMCQKCQDKFF